ncbi:hypothetical protein [Amycolatopsis plumensis]|uniref:Sulfotransferase n=1 Tax=Amycolatopsis plumensis TaxID=236508 RepID=A0ABV5TWI3_9PSEU
MIDFPETPASGETRSNTDFFRSGRSGQWRDRLDPAALDHYHRRVAELEPPDLAEWLHPAEAR